MIAVEQAVLDDLGGRLAATRWPDQVVGGWRQGADTAYLRELCAYWAKGFDWRAAEARLNALPQFRVAIDGAALHFVHMTARGDGAVPLLLANGWPSSVVEYREVIPRLAAAGFHVVAPALPGYGFSDRPTKPGTNSSRIAEQFAALMTGLGYDRFVAHGSDMGAGVVERLRQAMPDRLLGAHFSNVYWGYPEPQDPSPEEQAYLGKVQGWQMAEGAYAMMHATKPQTLAAALNDSPAGLAAWIIEKFESWSDGGVAAYERDDLCANLTIYWTTQTIGSSIRLYAEAMSDREAQQLPQRGKVPVGVLVMPKDILPAPRTWGERWLNLIHWTEAPEGGHFPAWEQPKLFVDDIASFTEAAGLRR